MHDTYSAAGDEEWVIWSGEHGLVTTATLGHVEVGSSGRKAWLDDPFDMVGRPFQAPFGGRRIPFKNLPEDCRTAVINDYKELWSLT